MIFHRTVAAVKSIFKNALETVKGIKSGTQAKIHWVSDQRAVRTITGTLFILCLLTGIVACSGRAAKDIPDPASVSSVLPAASSNQIPLPAETVKPTVKPTYRPTAVPAATASSVPTTTPAPTAEPTLVPAETAAPAADPSQNITETEILTPAESVNPSEAASAPSDTVPSETAASDTVTPAPEQQAQGPSTVVRIGNTSKAQIAFTFDDGGENMANILDILNKKGIKGTFFLLAGELKKNPQLWQQAVKDGHLVCNHTVHHYTNLPNKSEDVIRQEILGWEDAAREVLGDEYLVRMKAEFPYFRSPGGNKSDRLQRILGELGYTKTIYWTVEDCYFINHNPDNISLSQHYINDAENGAIFLLHPGHYSSVESIIDELQAEGYTFTTVPEVLN